MLDQFLLLAFLYCLTSILSILLYRYDKKAAVSKSQRISENTLHIVSLLGGWLGAFYAQKAYRHKTQKASFRFVFWITVFMNAAGVVYILGQIATI